MYSQRKLEKLTKQFERDLALAAPFQKSDKIHPVRANFMNKLSENTEFSKTNNENKKRFAQPTKQTIKNFGSFEKFIICAFMAMSGIIGYEHAYTNLGGQETEQTTTNKISISVFMFVSMLFGLLVGGTVSVIMKQESRDTDITNFYNRLVVRLFDILHEEYPDLDENMLKHCNPEMARVITALMVANMPEKDTHEIQKTAIKFAKTLQNQNNRNKTITFHNCNEEIKNAIAIIEQNLLLNPHLQDTILAVYRGNIPATFKISQNEKTR